MKRNTFIMLGVASVIMVSGLGGVTSYATSSGTVNNQETQTTQVSITTYNQATVKGLGNWEQQSDGTWKFKCYSGGYLVNSWLESLVEENAFYFVDANGTMLTNAVTPDNYTLDSTGLWKIGKASAPAITETTAHQTQASVESVPVETASQNMDKNEFDALQEYYESRVAEQNNDEEYLKAVQENAQKMYGN